MTEEKKQKVRQRRKPKAQSLVENESEVDFFAAEAEAAEADAAEIADAQESGDPTFAEAKGTEANQHAKKLAKRKAQYKDGPRKVFYTMKGPAKVVKVIVKKTATLEVYVGSLKRNKADLESMMKHWKKEGAWVEAHDRKAKIEEIRKGL